MYAAQSAQGRRMGQSVTQSRETRSYPHARTSFWIGVACTAFFILMGALSFADAHWNVDGSYRYPRATAAVLVIFWSVWSLLGVYLIRASVRGRLCLSDDGVHQRGAFRSKAVQWAEVSRARWRLFPANGSVVIRGPGCRLVIEFGDFVRAERREIIDRLRDSVSIQLQENWEVFQERWLKLDRGARP